MGPYRVLDLTDESGVFCTKILGALGADVIKVEPPEGHHTRRIGPFHHDDPDPEKSLHWLNYNLNKRSITLNIESATGRDIFRRLVRSADFVAECFPPGHMEKLGLGYTDLAALNPRLIHTSVTPWGATGPYSGFQGSDLVCTAMSGFMSMVGDPDRPPVTLSTPFAYIETGVHAAAATMVAHWYRKKTGKGQHIDVSVHESIMAQSIPYCMLWRGRKVLPTRGTAGATIPGLPSNRGIFKCKDGYVLCSTSYARSRKGLREWLAGEGMAEDLFDESWNSFFLEGAPVTFETKDRIEGIFARFATRHTMEELMRQGQERGIHIAKEPGIRDVMNDPHLDERKYFVEIEHPELKDNIVFAGSPFKSNEMAWSYRWRAPHIGEHNVEVYSEEMKMSREDLVVLRQGGII
ncbi:MAG: CoA transferase [Chloroflexi bacterium]|nr:CoA transferase [Chloroflexota bacterium]